MGPEEPVTSRRALRTATRRPLSGSKSSSLVNEPEWSRSKWSQIRSHCDSRTSSRTRNCAFKVTRTSSDSMRPVPSTSSKSNHLLGSSKTFGNPTTLADCSRHMGQRGGWSLRSNRQSKWNRCLHSRRPLPSRSTPTGLSFSSSKHTAHSECSSAAVPVSIELRSNGPDVVEEGAVEGIGCVVEGGGGGAGRDDGAGEPLGTMSGGGFGGIIIMSGGIIMGGGGAGGAGPWGAAA
mmetsp:Transcript_37087/g.118916  ORF Transcript_37087/g.118916 Transcript_37087/m.118916 type:complete len:235 (+) Transcript_37087:721-1425(+)